MYLKQLELMGFKSFPEKIFLEFGRCITAVVGPNGSGKSNIADGVRWVLGEQSARSLRGSKMEDVIFSGTANRRALGFAEVSMILDNSDQMLPVDYNEIKITRRVYRSGESEYAMNGTTCRLRDIHELFMDTGVGKEGYSIIGQGRIEEILSTRSEDRRMLFEEAAGIVKYKSRRQETEAKLSRERDNLVRINDIIIELNSQLLTLEPQSVKAKQYLDLRENLKLMQVNLFLDEVTNSEKQLTHMTEATRDLQNQLENEKNQQIKLGAYIQDLKNEDQQSDNDIKEVNTELLSISTALEQKESELKLTGEKINHILSNIDRIKDEIEKKNESISGLIKEISTETTKSGELNTLINVKNDMLSKKLADFQEFDTIMHERTQFIEKSNTDIIETIRKTTDVKGNKNRAEDLYTRLEQRMEQLQEDIINNKQQTLENTGNLEVINKKLDQLEDDFEKYDFIIENYSNEKDSLNVRRQDIIAEITHKQKRINECNSRLKLLTELERDFEGYYKSVKAILKKKRDMPDKYSGICGAVAELCETDKEYETAIEIALGASIQNIVTQNEDDAKLAITYLKESGEGRATFLPMTAIKHRVLTDKSVLQENGIIGLVVDKLRYDQKYEVIFSNLLGQVVIADSLENGIKAFKKHKHSVKIVTLEGDLLSPGGAMTGGSINQRSSHIFTRTRELKELPEKLHELSTEEKKLNELLQDIEAKINTTKEEIQKVRERIQTMALEKNTLLNSKSQTENQLSRTKSEYDGYQAEKNQLMSQLEDTNLLIRELDNELLLLEQEIKTLQDNMENYLSVASSDKEDRDVRTREITDIKVELSGLEEKSRSITANINRFTKEIEERRTEIKTLLHDIDTAENDKLQKESDIKKLVIELASYRTLMLDKQEALSAMNKNKDEIRNRLSDIESRQTDKSETISRISNELTRLEIRKEQTETDSKKLYDRMWDDYKITYQSALEYKRTDMTAIQMQQAEKKIKNELLEMGEVSVGAIEEYKTVRARHEHLTSQVKDIQEAEEKLKDIINTLTELMESQFREQFKVISENFGIVFSEMFGGGQASLRLSDEKNVLNASIDIIAQPPGKNLQNMMLLSGGERALTATALLFGILRMKPSPFCILDEIEAALDDANVQRFANYLKNFAGDTQFILITHRKGTMEAADVLYGVTMQEQGISKLVSVKFNEAF